jgi:hypothetical protein
MPKIAGVRLCADLMSKLRAASLLYSCPMSRQEIIQQLNQEIELLQQAVRALRGTSGSQATGSQPKQFITRANKDRRGRSGGMSAEARARIAAAQKAHWAKLKAGKKK